LMQSVIQLIRHAQILRPGAGAECLLRHDRSPRPMKHTPRIGSLAAALATALALAGSPLVHASSGPGVSWQAAAADADIDRY
ncbi:hypothetical protein ABTF07_20560, partial [Acinetobacter baumannii]